MGEHFKLIPAEIYKTQMIVRPIPRFSIPEFDIVKVHS